MIKKVSTTFFSQKVKKYHGAKNVSRKLLLHNQGQTGLILMSINLETRPTTESFDIANQIGYRLK